MNLQLLITNYQMKMKHQVQSRLFLMSRSAVLLKMRWFQLNHQMHWSLDLIHCNKASMIFKDWWRFQYKVVPCILDMNLVISQMWWLVSNNATINRFGDKNASTKRFTPAVYWKTFQRMYKNNSGKPKICKWSPKCLFILEEQDSSDMELQCAQGISGLKKVLESTYSETRISFINSYKKRLTQYITYT